MHLLQTREDRVYYPAHGPAVTKPRQLVRGMIGHRRQRENQILKLIGAGTGVIEEMVPQMYKGIDQQLWPAAGRSVLAHLIDLEQRGLVAARRCGMGAGGNARAALPWTLFAAALALAVWALWPGAKGDVLGTTLTAFEKQNRLTVFSAQLSPVVAANDEQLLGLLKTRQIAVIPARVDYSVDLSAMSRQRLEWDAEAKRLDVLLPPSRAGRAQSRRGPRAISARRRVDQPHDAGQIDPREHRGRPAAGQPGGGQSGADRASPAPPRKTRCGKTLSIPLEVAGYDDITVSVRFDGEKEAP